VPPARRKGIISIAVSLKPLGWLLAGFWCKTAARNHAQILRTETIPVSNPAGAPPARLRLGTRGSPLALAQAHDVKARLIAAHGAAAPEVEIVVIKTSGDLIQDRALSEAGGKGLFTKELDSALLQGDVDLAVHSAKDLPTFMPDGLTIAGYLPREDARDAWISDKASGPRELPPGSIVGTASLRRSAMLLRLRPDLAIRLLRGNVETRLAKLARGEIDATILALAGLKRLKLTDKATRLLDPRDFVPAVGQGAIAITARSEDAPVAAALAPILDHATGVALACERALLQVLDGSCHTPIGGHARLEGDNLHLHAMILRPDGSRFFETEVKGSAADPIELGELAARQLLTQAPPGFLKV
jgi:hydroxymethylbilane synthase